MPTETVPHVTLYVKWIIRSYFELYKHRVNKISNQEVCYLGWQFTDGHKKKYIQNVRILKYST